MTEQPVAHMSYSQLNGFLTCGEQYRLEKVHRIYGRPSWAAVGGSTVHGLTEAWDLIQLGQGGDLAPWDVEFERQTAEAEERSGYSRDDFRVSGRASKQYPNKEDPDWWAENGPLMVERWQTWRQVSPWEVAIFDGRPAVELEVNALFGESQTLVKAYIDRVMVNTATGELAVVDLKTGTSTPPSTSQLGMYAESLLRCHVVSSRPQLGFYWMGRTGATTIPENIDQWEGAYFDYAYEGVARLKQTGDLYLPHPSNLCSSCGVREYCRYMGGPKAGEVPPPWKENKR